MGSLGKVRGWLQGKKTMLGGVVLIAAGVIGVAFGQVSVEQGAALVGFGISIAGWAAKADRHQAELRTVLAGIAETGAMYRAGDKDAIQKAVKEAVPGVLDGIIREAKS